MFTGALIAWILVKSAREISESYTIPVASEAIAGESLMGVLMSLPAAAGITR